MRSSLPARSQPLNSQKVLALLRQYESRNVTFIEADGSWPIVWDRALGVHVWDADGKKYLDLTAAFGVAAAGHANGAVVRAGQRQMARLLHAMGDVHPHALKARLAQELSRLTFERWLPLKGKPARAKLKSASGHKRGKTLFCNSGFEAVEAALKTARLATGKSGLIAFEGAYHGLGYGALNATHRTHFREPFRNQLREFGHFVPFPTAGPNASEALGRLSAELNLLFRRQEIGAVLVEPVQVRGGINIPPTGLLPLLREVCDKHGALLILDEIYTGFGRTGRWFACEHLRVVPDIICLGKALTGGFPLSACVGSAEVMDAAWPLSQGEAIHTSTFLGHPVGCAMALAQIEELEKGELVRRSAELGDGLLKSLQRLERRVRGLQCQARGLGLLAGLELREASGAPATSAALRVLKDLLHSGYIMLPEGQFSNVLSFTPPLTITQNELNRTVNALAQLLERSSPVP